MPALDRRPSPNDLLTLPRLRREYGVGIRSLRREAARGSFPVYLAGTHWPHAMRREFEAWVRSTRIPIPTRLPDLDPEELERLVEATGRFEGPVRPEQRALSAELDRRAAEEDDA